MILCPSLETIMFVFSTVYKNLLKIQYVLTVLTSSPPFLSAIAYLFICLFIL